MSELLNNYLSLMNEVIFKHGGTIDKFIGDAIMVLFGALVTLTPEEQARKACECALAMQAAMAALQPQIDRAKFGELRMRIGIHQGEAVVGNFGSNQRSDYTAIGPTVNFASRIESACTPGEVFVSATVGGFLNPGDAVSTGTFELKGMDAPQPLFLLQRHPTAYSST